jgi:hypothetical protein
MAKEVTVEIDPSTGDFTVDLTGFKGKGCDVVLSAFKQLGTTVKEIRKPEFNQMDQEVIKR